MLFRSYYEREAMITEKTIMALYSGTLPLWIGGWRLPDVMRDLGFDVFDDIIDHSYSTLSDCQQRLDQAIVRNLHLLTDFERIKALTINLSDRFKHNVCLIEQNIFLNRVKEIVAKDSRLQDITKLWQLPV